MIVVVMGVSGSGKSTVGGALAEALGAKFLDADDFHPPANVAKMTAGVPLTDDDRWPWLDRVVDALRAAVRERRDVVLACSALRQAYRERLAAAGDVRFVHLRGDLPTIAERLAARRHRYMPASLLASQFATLEPPRDAIDVDIRSSVAAQVDAIVDALRRDAARTQCTSGEAVGDSAAAPTGDAAGGAGHR
jgi:carbohydrate kinase (thermoresistant glucokinase family)